MQRERPELEGSGQAEREDQGAQGRDSPQRPDPEVAAKGSARGQSEIAEGPSFDARHHEGGKNRDERQADLGEHHPPDPATSMRMGEAQASQEDGGEHTAHGEVEDPV